MKDKRKSYMVRIEREGGWGSNLRLAGPRKRPVLEFLTIFGGGKPSRNRVVVPARQATQPGGIGSLESILGLLKNLKIRAQ